MLDNFNYLLQPNFLLIIILIVNILLRHKSLILAINLILLSFLYFYNFPGDLFNFNFNFPIKAIIFSLGLIFIYGYQQKPSLVETSCAIVSAIAAINILQAKYYWPVLVNIELLAICSLIIIFNSKQEGAYKQGRNYALVHVFAGILLLIGISLAEYNSGSNYISSLTISNFSWNQDDILMSMHAWLILAGLLIMLGCPPFSGWLVHGYACSSVRGLVILQSFSTVVVANLFINIFYGNPCLKYPGILMCAYSIINLWWERDLRKIINLSTIFAYGYILLTCATFSSADFVYKLEPMKYIAYKPYLEYGACYKACLLMIAGILLRTTGSSNIINLGNIFAANRSLAIAGALASFFFIAGFDKLDSIIRENYLLINVCHYLAVMFISFNYFLWNSKQLHHKLTIYQSENIAVWLSISLLVIGSIYQFIVWKMVYWNGIVPAIWHLITEVFAIIIVSLVMMGISHYFRNDFLKTRISKINLAKFSLNINPKLPSFISLPKFNQKVNFSFLLTKSYTIQKILLLSVLCILIFFTYLMI